MRCSQSVSKTQVFIDSKEYKRVRGYKDCRKEFWGD